MKKKRLTQKSRPKRPIKVVIFSNYGFRDPYFDQILSERLAKKRKGVISFSFFHGYLNGNCQNFFEKTADADLLLTGSENFNWKRDDYLDRSQAEEELYELVGQAKKDNSKLLVMSIISGHEAIGKIAEKISSWEDPLVLQAIREL